MPVRETTYEGEGRAVRVSWVDRGRPIRDFSCRMSLLKLFSTVEYLIDDLLIKRSILVNV